MKYYTLDDIMKHKPCYNRGEIEIYMAGRKRISISGVLKSEAYSDDKIWLVVRLLPIDVAIEFANWCADSVGHLNINAAEIAAADARAYAAVVADATAAAYTAEVAEIAAEAACCVVDTAAEAADAPAYCAANAADIRDAERA